MKNTEQLLKDFLKSDKPIDDILSESSVKQEIKMEEHKIEQPVIEAVVVREEIKQNPIIMEDTKSNEVLKEIKDLKTDIEMLKEILVEILNKTLNSETLLTEKLKTIQSNPVPVKKRIILNRDDSGKIISADLQEEKIENI